jgi:hypothetical protein
VDVIQVPQDTLDAILKRVDSIVFELQALRQAVQALRRDGDEDLVAQLYGSWGKGTWKEYEPDIEWQRFSDG